ncbi:regulatory protein RecX [Thermovibrio sp.]
MSCFKELLSYALNLLLRKEYSEKALRLKLKEKFPSCCDEAIDSVLKELSFQGYLNEYRSVWNYFEEKERKGWGRRKIAYSLRQKGFSESVIREVELTYHFDYSYIKELISKRYNLKDAKERERAKRFLTSRGFSYSEISHILS